MSETLMTTFVALLALLGAACGDEGSPMTRQLEVENSLFALEPDLQWRLPDRLREISGLAVSPDGRLFGHDDERAVIYEIDVERGRFVKAFTLGDPALDGDFEGIAITPEGEFWLTTSRGRLYAFREGDDGESVSFKEFDSGASELCEIEGLAFLAAEDSLILACKMNWIQGMGDTPTRATQLLLSWSMDRQATQWRVLRDSFATAAAVGRFRPSSVEIDSQSGRIILLSANDAAMVELDGDGALLSARELEGPHPQPEGAAIMPDGSLVIADEGGDGQARLSRYPRAP
jgi:uncharacterized protein YjiK